MATVADDQQQNQQQGNQPPTIAGTSAPTGSGTGVGVGANTVSPVQQNAGAQNQQGYTDVASYLNANQQGGQQLGSQVASNLTNQYNTTKQGIDTSAQSANQSIQSGYTPENTQLIQQVANNPTSSAADTNTLSQFQGQLNDTYGGPTSWSDYGTQQGNVNAANQEAGLVNTPGGNNVLIQQVENQTDPGHTSQGINQLDTLLYQGNPNGVAQAQAAAQPFQSLNDYINSQNTAIGQNIGNAQTAANQTSQDALNAFTGQNGTLTNLNTNINNTTASDLAAAQAQQAALKADIGNLYGGVTQNNTPTSITGYGGAQTPWYNTTNYTVGQLSPQDLQSLGMTQDQWNALQGSLQQAGTSAMGQGGHNFAAWSPTSQIDLNQYLSQQDPTQAITNATTATPEQYAQMAAIQQLLGSKTPQGGAINPLNAAQAGTYNPATLNQFQYQNALTNAQQTAAAEQQAANQETQGLTSAADLAHAQSQHNGFLGKVGDIAQQVFPVGALANQPIVNQLGKYLDKGK